jgi:MarR family 2-MHQ and catechol resistance regulon transcriptional repressor
VTLRARGADEARELINEFLGSTHVFHSVVADVIEQNLLRHATGGRLTFPQLKLLRIVALEAVQSISEVAAFLGVTKAAASKSVDGLVRRGLLRRTEGRHDRRAIHLSLSTEGKRLVTSYERSRDRRLGALFGEFTAEDLKHTARLLDRLSARLAEDRAHSKEVCHQCSIYFRERCHVRQLVDRTCLYLRHRSRRRTP